MSRYAFNSASERCEPFMYGGCQGNSNNFLTMRECLTTCESRMRPATTAMPSQRDTTAGVCMLPIDQGPCYAMIAMYAYNPTEGTCVEFTYGGCEGNDNQFLTFADCMRRCGEPGSTESGTVVTTATQEPRSHGRSMCGMPRAQGKLLEYHTIINLRHPIHLRIT